MIEKIEQRTVLMFSLLTDALILWAAMNVATLTRTHTLVYLDSLWLLHRDQAVCVGLYLVAIFLASGYHPGRITDRFDSMYFACIGLGCMAAVILAATRLMPEGVLAISGRELTIGPVLAGLAFVLWRYQLGSIAARFPSLHHSYHIIGPEAQSRRIAEAINEKSEALADARCVTLAELQAQLQQAEMEGHPEPFFSMEAIIAGGEATREESLKALEFCENRFGRTYLYPNLDDLLFFRRSKLMAIAGIPLIEVANRQFFAPYVYLKRGVDIVCAAIGLLLALPIGVAAAIAIKCMSPGPVFYTQERMGLHGRPFRLYKFRTMIPEAEAKTGPVWASANDDRITPVGRFLRKHRIDEIPQLLNVLKGDMSLIGPRPERPHFHREFCAQWPLFERRLAVRPGVTSLSHVLGSYDSDPADRLRYDLMYISSLSLLTDMKILVATIRVVLGAKGAQ